MVFLFGGHGNRSRDKASPLRTMISLLYTVLARFFVSELLKPLGKNDSLPEWNVRLRTILLEKRLGLTHPKDWEPTAICRTRCRAQTR